MVGFALVFLVVPNRRVRLHHALAGALISAVLFEVAKRGFVLYVTNFPTYERLYGRAGHRTAVSDLDLRVLGRGVAGCQPRSSVDHIQISSARICAGLIVMNYCWRCACWAISGMHSGAASPCRSSSCVRENRQLASCRPAVFLAIFTPRTSFIPDDDGDWLLSADLDELTLAELYRAGPFILPVGELDDLPMDSHWDRALINRLQPIDRQAHGMMKQSIKSLLRYQMEYQE